MPGSNKRDEKAVEYDGDTNFTWSQWNGPQRLGKETEKIWQ